MNYNNKNNLMIVDEYTMVKPITKGAFGEVYLGFRKESQTKYSFKKKK